MWMLSLSSTTIAQTHESVPHPLSQLRVRDDVAYVRDGDPLQKCDLILPPTATRPCPVVVLVHGGGWISGDKWTLKSIGERLAQRNVAAVVINYRLAPKDKFPAQIDDVRLAIHFVRTHASEYGWDAERLGLLGYSAGGHLVALWQTLQDEPLTTRQAASAVSPSHPLWQSKSAARLAIAGGPPCDFRDLPPGNTSLAYWLGGSRGECPDAYRLASPASHASQPDGPIVLIHGQADNIVPVESSERMHRELTNSGATSRLVLVPRLGHMLTFLSPAFQKDPVNDLVQRLQSLDLPIRAGKQPRDE